jgi:hypothetical protein
LLDGMKWYKILFGCMNGLGCGDLPHMGGNFTSK